MGKSLNLSILPFPHGKWRIFLALSILQSEREGPRGEQLSMQNVMSLLTLAYGEGAWPSEAGMDWPGKSPARGQECPGLAG